MRWFIALIILGCLGTLAYRHYWMPDASSVEGAGESKGPGASSPETSDTQDASLRLAPAPTLPPPSPSEEARLRRAIEDAPGIGGDRSRWDLVRLLQARAAGGDRQEATLLLRTIFEHGGELAPQAAALLLQESPTNDDRIEYAVYIQKSGRGAPAYGEALLELGRRNAARPEDSAQVEAWGQLSQAYFSSDDPAFRARVRDVLARLVDHLILSPRRTAACPVYLVQAGDNLGRIARKYGTTVRAVQRLNGKKDTVIHPRTRLKVLQGTPLIEIDKSEFRLDLRLDGKYLLSSPVGLGKHGTTPVGEFVIDVRQENPAWQRVGQPTIPHGDPRNPLGDRWLGFKATELYSGYGIHGTSEPESIGEESSEGCVRLRNEEVRVLFDFVPTGTRVIIRE